jgi:hypothetical protein
VFSHSFLFFLTTFLQINTQYFILSILTNILFFLKMFPNNFWFRIYQQYAYKYCPHWGRRSVLVPHAMEPSGLCCSPAESPKVAARPSHRPSSREEPSTPRHHQKRPLLLKKKQKRSLSFSLKGNMMINLNATPSTCIHELPVYSGSMQLQRWLT